MQLHLVGGFLGSGKTTAIIAAAKCAMAQKKRVGIVTNDQGKYLVDTAFFKAANLPLVEVTGGCFCCHYDDLETVLKQLEASARPDVIFAESVGSCADIVATVVKPLQTFYTAGLDVASFTVFADIRLLRRRLMGQPLPFSENVVYIFDKQIEEAGLIVLNKADLLSGKNVRDTLEKAQARYPDKPILAQRTLEANGIDAWMDAISATHPPLGKESLKIDYERYGAGEAELAWLDDELVVEVAPGEGRHAVICLVETLTRGIAEKGYPVGHLKIFVRAQDAAFKISQPTLEEPDWQDRIPFFEGERLSMLINARVQAPVDMLCELVYQSIEILCWTTRAKCTGRNTDAFAPCFPKPQHRLE